MEHPIFDKPAYPFDHPDANELFQVLVSLTSGVGAAQTIDLRYRSCGPGLPPLDLGKRPELIWMDALNTLSAKGMLAEPP